MLGVKITSTNFIFEVVRGNKKKEKRKKKEKKKKKKDRNSFAFLC